MLNYYLIGGKASASDNVINGVQLDNVDDIRLEGRREILLSPLQVLSALFFALTRLNSQTRLADNRVRV